jgi:hypothetical protein
LRDWWSGWFLLTALHSGYRTSTRARRSLILGTAVAVAAAVTTLCATVNSADTWRVQDARGWLPVLLLPGIVLVALAFGVVWGLGAGLVASALTVISAVADGGAPFGTANTLNLLGFALVAMFLAAGWCYGIDRVRELPRWLVILSVLVFPIAVLIGLLWIVVTAPPFGGGSESGGATPRGETQAVLVYQQAETDPLAGLDRLPAGAEDYAWAYRVLSEGLERGDVDATDLRTAIDTALDHDWGLRKMTLLLHLDAEAELRLVAGFAAIACGLAPDHGVTLVRAGQATEDLAEHLADIWQEYRSARTREEGRDRAEQTSGDLWS